ncbi:ABC transporter permease [Gordonia sp. X0973]|uniref:ABC transporter permease n=1 Tax=Gordonia sp. X0973 TaxID=2742602 RepID=UPI000F52DFDF|nr:ABC transporter permease [Gordonia sp. X0973]QKT08568.1 ABC transporter permease [Gordonia sp. X0973]
MHHVGDALIRIGPVLVIVMVVLAGVAVAVNVASSGYGRDTAIAVVRATVQLTALAAVLAVVIGHLWASVLFIVLMSLTAAWTAATRITKDRRPFRDTLWCLLPAAVPTAVIMLAVVAAGVVPAAGIAIIPTAGIMLGNAMIATSLAGRHSLDDLTTRRGEVDAALSLGFSSRDARMEVVRPAAATALIPGIDQTRSVGLVTIPGSFVGMVLGGASTTVAAVMQLFVLIALLAVSAIAVLGTTELVSRGLLGVHVAKAEAADGPRRPLRGRHSPPRADRSR